MARKRYQKGCVYLDGEKWKGRYREDLITGERTQRIRREVAALAGKFPIYESRVRGARAEAHSG